MQKLTLSKMQMLQSEKKEWQAQRQSTHNEGVSGGDIGMKKMGAIPILHRTYSPWGKIDKCLEIWWALWNESYTQLRNIEQTFNIGESEKASSRKYLGSRDLKDL